MSQIVQTIANRMSEAKRLLLVTHVYPDGDNLGSALALLQVLKALGKDVQFYLSGDVPHVYRWLPFSEKIEDTLPSKTGSAWTIIALDSGDPLRMGEDFVAWYDDTQTLINIDHHGSNVQFGHINWVDPDYSSTAEMIIEIIDALGVELTRDMATCIFCAIYTDTGRFSYSNTNLRSLTVAARCVAAGAVPHQSYSSVYASRTLSGLKLLTLALRTVRPFANSTGCAFHIDQEMFSGTGTDVSDTEGFMETVTQVSRFKIIVFFKEVAPGVIKASLRCREPVNAAELAGKFDGGGHPRAAGFSMSGAIDEAYSKFIPEAEKFLAAVKR